MICVKMLGEELGMLSAYNPRTLRNKQENLEQSEKFQLEPGLIHCLEPVSKFKNSWGYSLVQIPWLQYPV